MALIKKTIIAGSNIVYGAYHLVDSTVEANGAVLGNNAFGKFLTAPKDEVKFITREVGTKFGTWTANGIVSASETIINAFTPDLSTPTKSSTNGDPTFS